MEYQTSLEFQTFTKDLKNALESALSPSITIQFGMKILNNGLYQDTLIIRNPKYNIAPSIYLNPYYSRFMSGMDLHDICDDILEAYYNAAPKEDFDVSHFLDFESAKQHICMRLINYDLNKENLKDCPHVRFHDLAIVFIYVIKQDEEYAATIMIQNTHLDIWNVSTEELHEIAKKQTPIHFPLNIRTIQEVLFPIPGIIYETYEDDRCNMLVISNELNLYGATAILYDGVLQKIADKLDSNLLIIPSSIHETIVLPVKECFRSIYVDGLIQDVNSYDLPDTEVLSDHAYYYCREFHEIIP